MNRITIIKGTFLDTPDKNGFRIRENHFLIIKDGIIDSVFPELPEEYRNVEIRDYSGKLIIPSFIDLHIHAPQFLQRGIGLDLQLIDWLDKYTFRLEKQFADPEMARRVYSHFADSLYRHGTLRASVFSTIHKEASLVLAEVLEKRGLSCLIGKVNMDCRSPEELTEDTEQSLRDTEEFINKLRDYPHQKAVITPRFAPCCSPDLMKGLSKLAQKYELPVQTHISENREEVEWVREIYPEFNNYHDVYQQCGLYRGKGLLLAHGVYLTEEEKESIRENSGTIIHCPEANLNLTSGIMPLGQFLDEGLNLGLGSDVGAGHNISIAKVIVRAVQSSKALHSLFPKQRVIKLHEAFYLATRGNGLFLGNYGSFDIGMPFDALIVEEDSCGDMDIFTPVEKLSRFLYSGDDRNIEKRYLVGKLI